MIAIMHSFMSNLSSPVQDSSPGDSRRRRHCPVCKELTAQEEPAKPGMPSLPFDLY